MHHPLVRWVIVLSVIGIIAAPLALANAYGSVFEIAGKFVTNFFVFLGALGK